MCDANAVEHRRMHACIDFGYRRLEDRFKNLGSTFAFSDAIFFDLCATTSGPDPKAIATPSFVMNGSSSALLR